MTLALYSRGIHHRDAMTGYWEDESVFSDAELIAIPAIAELSFDQVQVVFSRTSPSGIVDDVMLFSLAVAAQNAFVNILPIDDTQRADVESAIGTWWTSWKAQTPSTITLKEYRWHHFDVEDTSPGPAVRVTTANVVATGSGTTRLPDQVAHSVTFRTASRKHWGRVYTPALVPSALSAYGRLTDAQTDSRLDNWETLLESIDTVDVAGDGVVPVVWSRVGQALLSIDVIAMDSTCDVIRSRRAKHPSYFATADA